MNDALGTTRSAAGLAQDPSLLTAVLEGTPDPILFKDAECRVVLANRAALAMLGKSAGQVLGRTAREYMDDAATGLRLWTHDRRVLETGVPDVREEELGDPENRATYLATRSAYRDANGRIAGLILVARDITDLRRAWDAVARSEEKFATAFRSSAAAMAISDHASGDVVIEVNDAFETLFGYSKAEVVGKTHPEIWLWSDPAEYSRAVATFQETGKLNNFEFGFRRKDGELRTGLISAGRVVVNGRPCVLATSIDITDRKRAEETLRHDAERLSLILEATSGGVWDWNIQTGDAGFSPGYSMMLGYDPEEFGRNYRTWTGLVHPDDVERVAQHHTDHFAGRPFSIEFRMKEKSGKWHWVHSRGVVIERDAEGRPLRMVGTHSDIQARKQSEEDREYLQQHLAHAQKMECVGRLAAGVAHDFNNLMSVILMHAEFALDDVADNSTAAESVGAMRDAALKAAEVARQLVTVTQTQTLKKAVLDLNRAIADCTNPIGRLFANDIALEFSPAPDLRRVEADRGGIHQIILNLVINARDAMPSGGTLRIATRNVDIDQDVARLNPEATAGPHVLITVSDSGAGMDEATLARAFEPFFTTKRLGKGTGLGLSVVYAIVRQHGGFMTAASEPGRGSEFRIFLPAAEETSQPEAGQRDSAAACGPADEAATLV